MGESLAHRRLVRAIVSWTTDVCGLGDAVVLTDSGASSSASRPPTIDGYVPDVYVSRPGAGTVVIGEAKTPADLERPHSQMQMSAFLRWCARTDGSLLVVGVPWYMTRAARNMLGLLKRQTGTPGAQTVVLEQIAD